MPIKTLAQQDGGFFTPGDLTDAAALLIEVRGLERQRPTKSYGPKDTAIADVTVFDSEKEAAEGKPSQTIKGTIIQQTYLARDLFQLEPGDGVVQTLSQLPGKGGNQPSWVWRPVSRKVQADVVNYVEARDKAAEEALAAVPSFDDDED